MLLCNPARPATSENVLERFWLPDAAERVSQHGFIKLENSQGYLAVCIDPVTEILAKFAMEYGFPLSGSGQGPSPGAVFPEAPACLSSQRPVEVR